MRSSVSYFIACSVVVLQTVSLTGAHVSEDPARPEHSLKGLIHLRFKVSIKCLMTHMLGIVKMMLDDFIDVT